MVNKYKTEHRQVKLKCPKYNTVEEVDSGIADLLETLWSNEIYTYMSCQDNDDHIWLQFSTKEDFLKFLKEVDFYEITIDNVNLRRRSKKTATSGVGVGFSFPKEQKNKIKDRFRRL